MGGALLSLALIREDGASYYGVLTFLSKTEPLDPWVEQNVIPLIEAVPHSVNIHPVVSGKTAPWTFATGIARLLKADVAPVIISDWPDDIRYFCQEVITGPGTMIDVPSLRFEVVRVDAYPTDLPGAIQHNAWWDAMALRHRLERPS